MSKPASEGDVEGRRERGGGGAMFLLLLALRLFLLSVGCCLPGEQEGLQSEREQLRGRQRKRLVRAVFYSSSAIVRTADTL